MLIYKHILKRPIDVFLSIIGLIFLSPLIFSLVIIQSVIYKGQPFFFQNRPGKNGRIFKIIKFRSMTNKKNKIGRLLPETDRLTSFGIFIRKYSLDEIPQLFNVIKGDMSLIGPRPLLVKYLPLYNDFQKQRHLIKPGITGWAQINGRNFINWEEKFNYDVWYVHNISFLLDLKILLFTILKILKPEGIYGPEDEFVPDFKGSPKTQNNQ